MVEIKNPMWFSCHRSGGSQERSLGTVLEEEQKAGSGPHIQPQSLIFKKLLKLDQNWIYRLKKPHPKECAQDQALYIYRILTQNVRKRVVNNTKPWNAELLIIWFQNPKWFKISSKCVPSSYQGPTGRGFYFGTGRVGYLQKSSGTGTGRDG